MELAGRSLALCCVFMVFTCASPVGFYNPDLYIDRITELLGELHRDLAHTNVGDKKVNGIRRLDMEHGKSCPGTIVHIFQSGTKTILKLELSPSVSDTTEAIDNCVTKLWGECKILQKQEPKCNYSPQREKVIDFVTRFRSFSKRLRLWNTCKSTSNQEYGHSEDIEYRPGETTSICGKH